MEKKSATTYGKPRACQCKAKALIFIHEYQHKLKKDSRGKKFQFHTQPFSIIVERGIFFNGIKVTKTVKTS